MDPDPDSTIMAQFLFLGFLTLVNAFFASAEMAIVSVNKNRIRFLAEEGNKKAILLQNLLVEPTKFLSTVQVGITLAGFFASASAASGLSDDLGSFLSAYKVPYSSEIALILITICLSYVTLVFGELYPKRIALQKAEAIAMFAVRPILVISNITAPFVKILSMSTSLLLRITGMDREDLEEKVSKEEIKSMVEVGQEHGVINETEKEMINSIFDFDDKLAEEVMTPRTAVYLIDIATPISELVDEILEMKYSRIPVYEGDSDNIIGILYLKDFFVAAKKHGFENIDLRKLLHTPYFVPESKMIDELFKELQASKKHMAILIDEYGGFSGLVTIEDLIEEIMGNIADEHDDEEPEIKKIDNNTFIVNGLTALDVVNDQLDINLHSDKYETVNGFLVNLLGRIPKEDETKVIEHEELVFKIEKVKEKRIDKVKICIQRSSCDETKE